MTLERWITRFNFLDKIVISIEVLIVAMLLLSPVYLRWGVWGHHIFILALTLFILLSFVHFFIPVIQKKVCQQRIARSVSDFSALELTTMLLAAKYVGLDNNAVQLALIEKLRKNDQRPIDKESSNILLSILKNHKERQFPRVVRSIVEQPSCEQAGNAVVKSILEYLPSNLERDRKNF